MFLKKYIHPKVSYLSTFCLLLTVFPIYGFSQKSKSGGDFIESTSHNEESQGKERSLQYRPDGQDFVCINGKNRFTRALYGTNTAFRVETSDMPEFGLFMPNMGGNIQLGIVIGNKSLWLNKAQHIESRYRGGMRVYEIMDPILGEGKLKITVLAMANSEGVIFRIENENIPKGLELLTVFGGASNKRFSRNGDLGVDDPRAFDLHPEGCEGNEYNIRKNTFSLIYGKGTKGGERELDGVFSPNSILKLASPFQLNTPSEAWKSSPEGNKPIVLAKTKLSSEAYFAIKNPDSEMFVANKLHELFFQAEKKRETIAGSLKIDTPDAYFNTLGGTLSAAADGIWDDKTYWQHGAVGWRMPLNGWRAAYVGDAIGWHERARLHFDGYAASQITDIKPIYPHPTQDSTLHLARAEKRWGTQMYSNGYITRNPNETKKMHHYDMNLVYIDELLWHLNWTGDLDYARKIWPVLKLHLVWEKRNFDPNDDGLYDAYACIWASDALQYNSGGVTHSSAYNYRANKMAAEIARKIGEDPTPYESEAKKILQAINQHLWLPKLGHWAEFQDLMGNRLVHPDAAVWTVYHAIDSDIQDLFQAYQATRYVDTEIPHIPVKGIGLKNDNYHTVSTTNWLPYSWSINNVAFAEVGHTALAYWEAGRKEEAFHLFKSNILDGMYLGASPGNIGQISFYDAARGECYRDFGDPIGVYSRDLVQGLFGILPDALNGRLVLRPGFPAEWNHASIETSDIRFSFERKEKTDYYSVDCHFQKPLALTLLVDAQSDDIASVTVNGKAVPWSLNEAVSKPQISIQCPLADKYEVEITWAGKVLDGTIERRFSPSGKEITLASAAEILQCFDPQDVLSEKKNQPRQIQGKIVGQPGHRTVFVQLKQGKMNWWQPVDILINESYKKAIEALEIKPVPNAVYTTVNMDAYFNESVSHIFKNEYLSPRSPYTTLEVPTQGIGEWCHPLLTANIDDSGFRKAAVNNVFRTPMGIPFRTPSDSVAKNIAFTSLWNNFPDSLSIPLSGKASHIYFLLAGTTNHMQYHVENGSLEIVYQDGTTAELSLINPETWAPIEQDFYVDGLAFKLDTPKPYRVAFKNAIVSRNLGEKLGIKKTEVYGREIDGGAGILLNLPLDSTKELKELRLKTVANEVIVGLMAVTLAQ